MKELLAALVLLSSTLVFAQTQLRYNQNQTPTYDEVIAIYKDLGAKYEKAQFLTMGSTDSGRDLHLFLIGAKSVNDNTTIEEAVAGKAVVLINNGIHPGESCGIDASIEFAEGVLKNGNLNNVVYAIIPVYNIGGSLNRGTHSRANQLGPEQHGFRGNARNLDLNRDFIKADSKNTKSFYQIFQALQPHIFIDTHTSNGADYQYTMTLISTQKDKLNPVLSKLMTSEMEPFLFKNMEKAGWEMTPYVNVFGYTPEKGFDAFLETPRYASGYTALFNTIGFITETHMLKPYKDRVKSTLAFLNLMAKYSEANHEKLIAAKNEATKWDKARKSFDLNWTIDTAAVIKLKFKGYEYEYLPSNIGDYQRLKYLADKPKTYTVNYRDTYKATDSAAVPRYFVIPQAWTEVIENLEDNYVEMTRLGRDTLLEVSSYYVKDAEFASALPYEGHFPLRKMRLEKEAQQRKFLKGDYLISTSQNSIRFIMAVLEPNAVDSYLRWNYFDEIFQQKEYFSAYVFEDTAEKLLADNPDLRKSFEEWKSANPEAAKNVYAALFFIYQHSPYYEKEHLRYPVARIE